jgi:hypothetical protein
MANLQVSDEELRLNYRMSGYVQRPDWYHLVNIEEEEREWDWSALVATGAGAASADRIMYSAGSATPVVR